MPRRKATPVAPTTLVLIACLGPQARAGDGGMLDAPILTSPYTIDVLPDEPVFIYVYGEFFHPDSRITVDGVGDLIDQGVHSPSLVYGYSPRLPEGVSPGWKRLIVSDSRGSFTFEDAIFYVEYGAPYLKDCWPYEIGPEGGTLLHFHGRNFREGLVPRFEGIACADPVLLSEYEITAFSPALEPRSLFDLYAGELTDGSGGPVITLRNSMLHVLEGATTPVLTAVEPAEVDARSGTHVTIRGERLRNDSPAQLYVMGPGGAFIGDIEGRVSGEPLTLVDSIDGISPRMDPLDPSTPPGRYDLVYHDPRGESVLAGALLYLDNIRSVTPSEVAPEGGTPVIFDGYEIENDWVPRLGGVPCKDVVYESSSRITAVSPPLPPGRHDADMVNDDGAVAAFLPGAVQVPGLALPRIISVDPPTITTRGGDLFTVTTDSWHGDYVPVVGGVPLINIDASSETVIRGETPPLPPGVHSVRLVGRDGAVIAVLEDAVTAVAPGDITIESVSPFEVAVGGGTIVHMTGTGFYPGLVPRLGGLPFATVEVIDSEHLQGESPPLEEGPHDAAVEEAGAIRAVLSSAVLAVAASLTVEPVAGSLTSTRFAPGGASRIAVPVAGFPLDAVLRVGGQPVLPSMPGDPCHGGGAGTGGGGAAAGEFVHRVLEGLVPDLEPGLYTADVYLPGFGVLATLDDAVEVVRPDAPPAIARIASADVQPDGSTRLYVFGSGFGAETTILAGGVPLVGAIRVSGELIVGNAPPLAPGEEPGPRDVQVDDPRGGSVFPAGITYVAPEPPGTRFLRGDANASGRVDISDAITILGYLFLGSPTALSCDASADVDAGGGIDITDPIQLLQHLFLGGAPPPQPYPECGPDSRPGGLACASGTPCGAGGGEGGAATGRGAIVGAVALRPNVHVLSETPLDPRDPVFVDVSTVTGEVVIDDPPGGVDLQVGDVITGFVPLSSQAIHSGIAYQLKVGEELPDSCFISSVSEKAFLSRPATINDTFEHFELDAAIPWSGSEARLSSKIVAAARRTPCDLDEGVGGGAAATGGGGEVKPLIDLNLTGVQVLDLQVGESRIQAGFHRLRVLYGAGEANLGISVSDDGLSGVDFFSGIILDSEVVAYIDSHLEKTIHEEKKVGTIRKDHVVFVLGVPILFTLKAELFAGIDVNAQVNMYADAGVKASFGAGLGFRFDGEKIHNLSRFDPPSFDRAPDTPNFDLDGSLTIRPYVRPELHLFAGILFEGLTADLGIRSEIYTRFHAAGTTQPVPCFQWGFDAGMTVTLNPEIQLFGYDLFDETFDVLELKKDNVFGGEIGCKQPPVAIISYTAVPIAEERFEVRLDASRSYDPDGGPLRFRWDFDADGVCDRATNGDPRTTFVTERTCSGFDPVHGKLCVQRIAMRLRVTDDEGESVEKGFWVNLQH